MNEKFSRDDVVITKVENKVKVWREIGGTAGDGGVVDVMNNDGDIVGGDCSEEALSEGVRRELDESDGVMNEAVKSSGFLVTRTVFTDSGVVWL